jgi:CBS domain-containing protein
MKVRECMTGQPLTIKAADPIQSAAKIMRECDVGFLPVLSEDKLVGALTDRDIVIRACAMGFDLANHQCQEIMSSNPQSCSPETSLEEAAQIMSQAKVRRLPVLQDGKLVGLLSLGDLAVATKGNEEMSGTVLEHVSEPIGPKCVM